MAPAQSMTRPLPGGSTSGHVNGKRSRVQVVSCGRSTCGFE